MRDLYSEVLRADREMKQLIAGLPEFFGFEAVYTPMTPAHKSQQRAAFFLAFAHKVCQPILKSAPPLPPSPPGLICFLQFVQFIANSKSQV